MSLSDTRAPTVREILFRLLETTHTTVKTSVAAEEIYNTRIAPFYDSASLPIQVRKHGVNKILRIYDDYVDLKKRGNLLKQKKASSPAFDSRLRTFRQSLDRVFFIPANGDISSLEQEQAEKFELLRVNGVL